MFRHQPCTPSESIARVSKVTPPRRKQCRGHHRHPIWQGPILGFHPETSSHEVGRAMSSTTVPPRRKTTSKDAVTVGTNKVDARFSSGAKSSTYNPRIRGRTSVARVGRDRAHTARNVLVAAARRKLSEPRQPDRSAPPHAGHGRAMPDLANLYLRAQNWARVRTAAHRNGLGSTGTGRPAPSRAGPERNPSQN